VTVDAHVHVWDPATRDHSWLCEQPEPLRRGFGAEELSLLAAASGVSAVVLVQVLDDLAETRQFLSLAASGALVAGPAAVVGWVDLEAPEVAETLAALRDGPGGGHLAGIRHLVESAPDGFLSRPGVQRGLKAVRDAGLVYDLLVHHRQLAEATEALAGLEGLRIVLDHCGKPGIASGMLDPWRADISRLARNELVTCKISGLVTEAGARWSAAQIRPYIGHVLERFGPERCMIASDWPVCTVRASYPEVITLAGELLEGLARPEREAVLDANARRVYGLAGDPEQGGRHA